MSLQEVNTIKYILETLDLHPTYLEHEPVITSHEAAKTRGFELKQGIKAIVCTNGLGDWVVVNVPADKKVNLKKAAPALGWHKRDIRMATEDEVLSVTGCQIGSVPPFGHKTPITILVDETVFDNTESAFNIGLRTHSLYIPTQEMKKVFAHCGATYGSFIKTEEAA